MQPLRSARLPQTLPILCHLRSRLLRTSSAKRVSLPWSSPKLVSHGSERLNPKLNAYITVTADDALAQARKAESEIQHGHWRGPLHGIPLGIKDNIDIAGVKTTEASAVFLDRVPSEDAEVVRRLKAAGAVLLGKHNMHEAAFGTTGAISHFGPAHNPWALDRITGGSSSGSAAAVSAALGLGAVATDGGGSIRLPSAYCGVVGLKPTYGLVSIRGGGGWWSVNHLGRRPHSGRYCSDPAADRGL